MKKIHLVPMTLIAVAILAGCNSTKPTTALKEAHSNYDSALINPNITAQAPLELKEAADTLALADQALSTGEKDTEINHLAYLANQRVEIARETATRKTAEAAVANARSTRTEIRLEARTAEANAANEKVAVLTKVANQQAEDLAAADANAANDQAQIAAQQAQLQAQLKELNAKQTERGLVITLGDVLFATSKSQLKTGALNNLQKLADYMRQNKQQRLLIEGHTDSIGSESSNQKLSERRAESVRNALVNQMGISSDRVTTRGYGESYPVAGNETDSDRQTNRRVEIVLSDAHGNITSR